ncbi:MAG: hypothetical protein ACLSDQ_11385 [Adlercreutzia equolifaciens]
MSAYKLYALCFLFMGFAMYASAFFTALNNGLVSALISFLRTLVFQVAAVIVLPMLFGIDGIWLGHGGRRAHLRSGRHVHDRPFGPLRLPQRRPEPEGESEGRKRGLGHVFCIVVNLSASFRHP